MLIPSILAALILPGCLGFLTVHKASKFHFRQRTLLQLLDSSENVIDRRCFVAAFILSSPLFIRRSVSADDDQSLTTKLFNPDGSLKAGRIEAAQEHVIDFKWDASDLGLVNVDGVTTAGSEGSQFKLSYNVPAKWGTGENLYLDSSANATVCTHITVYQATGKVEASQLDRATTIGVGTALAVTDDLFPIRNADLIGGRRRNKGEQTYFEFDLAAAPKTCSDSSENLGLGFCPFDSIYLLSATLIDGNLFVIAVECDKFQWKQASADLKRVRSSFSIETA